MIDYFEVISNGNTLRGLVHIGTLETPIIIVHGFFSSNKIGPYRLYYQIAETLNRVGYSVYRVDLSAMGESDGDSDHIEFENHVQDLNNIINSVCRKSSTGKVHLLAHCVGCCTAIESAVACEDKVNSITLISPFIPARKNYEALIGSDNLEKLDAYGCFERKTIICQKSYIDAGSIIVDEEKISSIRRHGPFAFMSERDEFGSITELDAWAQKFDVPFDVIANADHNFLDSRVRTLLIQKLRQRFEELAE